MPYIAVVDDEQEIREILELQLGKSNFEVRSYPDGDAFIKSLKIRIPDLVLLDIMMENMNGYEVLSEIKRKAPEMSVVFLTAKSQTLDKVLGLDLGADDYISKPFYREELIARINAVLRRKKPSKAGGKPSTTGVFEYKTLVFKTAEKTLEIDGKLIEMTRTEFLLLKLLSSSPKKVFTRDEILDAVWDDAVVNERTIDVHIRRLRKKMGIYESMIKTHSGFGYSLSEPE